jgi:hypothetical protein
VDVSGPARRGSAARGGLGAVAVLLGAALIAAAASGDVAAGSPRRPGDRVLDLLFSFGIVLGALVLLLGAVVYALTWRARMRGGEMRKPMSLVRAIAILTGAFLLLLAIAYVRRRDLGFDGQGVSDAVPPGSQDGSVPPGSRGYEPEFATMPVLIVAAAVLAAVVAVVLARRARRRSEERTESPPPTLSEVLADTLDDLRSEPDPRRAVIAAYARLERALAAAGHARRRSDAPGEYLARVLREANVAPYAVERLTALFARAKFSQHEVGEEMRSEAIEALEEVREELRAAERAHELVPV